MRNWDKYIDLIFWNKMPGYLYNFMRNLTAAIWLKVEKIYEIQHLGHDFKVAIVKHCWNWTILNNHEIGYNMANPANVLSYLLLLNLYVHWYTCIICKSSYMSFLVFRMLFHRPLSYPGTETEDTWRLHELVMVLSVDVIKAFFSILVSL